MLTCVQRATLEALDKAMPGGPSMEPPLQLRGQMTVLV